MAAVPQQAALGQAETIPESNTEMLVSLCEDGTVERLAGVFRTFGDGTRLRILFALLRKEMCVNDLAQNLGMTVSAVSHQLRILRQGELVRTRREGKTVYYAIADHHVSLIIRSGAEHVLGD